MADNKTTNTLLTETLGAQILPIFAQSREVTQIFAGPPFNYAGVEHWILQKKWLISKKKPPQQIIQEWHQHGVKKSIYPRLFLVYEGTADLRVGIDDNFAQVLELPRQGDTAGLTVLRVPAPAAIYFPAGIAFSDGYSPYQENHYPQSSSSRTLCLAQFDEVLANLIISQQDSIYSTHALQLDSDIIQESIQRYAAEIEKYAYTNDPGTAAFLQKVLLEIIQHVQQFLKTTPALRRNTCWPPFDRQSLAPLASVSDKNKLLWREISEYIDSHLDYELSWESLAAEIGISAVHLNRLFLQITGETAMRYVTKRRLDAARLMLVEGTYPIKEIAALVGFASSDSFRLSFRRYNGHSPRQYRLQKARVIHTKKWK